MARGAEPWSAIREPCGRCAWLELNGGSMLVVPASGGVLVVDLERKRKVVEKVMDGLLPPKNQ